MFTTKPDVRIALLHGLLQELRPKVPGNCGNPEYDHVLLEVVDTTTPEYLLKKHIYKRLHHYLPKFSDHKDWGDHPRIAAYVHPYPDPGYHFRDNPPHQPVKNNPLFLVEATPDGLRVRFDNQELKLVPYEHPEALELTQWAVVSELWRVNTHGEYVHYYLQQLYGERCLLEPRLGISKIKGKTCDQFIIDDAILAELLAPFREEVKWLTNSPSSKRSPRASRTNSPNYSLATPSVTAPGTTSPGPRPTG